MAASSRDGQRTGGKPLRPGTVTREGQGSTRRLILNLMEAFFRRPWLILLPLVFALAWGVSQAANIPTEYRSVGTISATTQSLLGDLTQTPNNQGFSFETPASVTARNINELLRTKEFLSMVLARAELVPPEGLESLMLGVVRQSTGAFADGDNLVRIAATTSDREQSQVLASATLASYVQWKIDADVGESTRAEEFFEQLVATTEVAMNDARADLNDYLLANPVDREDERPVVQELEIQRLQSVLTRAETQYQAALDKLDEARLATAQATKVVEQRLQVLDEPELPGAPEPRLKKAVTTVAIYGILGAMISAALLVVIALMDRTIRIPEDIEANFGLDVLAVVPRAGR